MDNIIIKNTVINLVQATYSLINNLQRREKYVGNFKKRRSN